MDKRILFISLIGYCLMIITYTLDLVDKYNIEIGILIILSTIVIISLVIKYFLDYDINNHQEGLPKRAIIGKDVEGKEIVLFKDLEQSNKSNERIIGKRVKGKKVIFENIRQK